MALEKVYSNDHFTLYREPNRAGGYRYWSDSVGGGVVIWDTNLASAEELLAAIRVETGVSEKPLRVLYASEDVPEDLLQGSPFITVTKEQKETLLFAVQMCLRGQKLKFDSAEEDSEIRSSSRKRVSSLEEVEEILRREAD